MKVTILAIGKKHDAKLEAAILEYSKRLKHYISLDWKLVEAKVTLSMSNTEIRNVESDVLLHQIDPTDTIILLDETGKNITSIEMSEKIQSYMNASTKNLVFVIGGAHGVNDELTQKANFIWSLSALVFPHQLVRLMLVEQLYRAHTILAGENYHHR